MIGSSRLLPPDSVPFACHGTDTPPRPPAPMPAALDQRRAAIDRCLARAIDGLLAHGPAQDDPLVGRMYRWMRHYLDNGGQRMHGIAVMLAYEACGGQDTDAIVPVAAALQLYHHHTLVHDDLYDEDHSRRGWPTTHQAFADWYGNRGPHPAAARASSGRKGRTAVPHATQAVPATRLFASDALRRGSVVAFAYGKMCRALAGYLIAGSGFGEAARLEATRLLDWHDLFDNAAQVRDVHHEGQAMPDPATCLDNAWLKTGRLFEVCARVGARLAQATEAQCEAVQAWAGQAALAYQLQDDLEDLAPDSEKGQGRGAASDLQHCKPTYLYAMAMTLARGADLALLQRWQAGEQARLTAGDVIAVLDRCGAMAACAAEVQRCIERSLQALASARPAFDAVRDEAMRAFARHFVSPAYWRRRLPAEPGRVSALIGPPQQPAASTVAPATPALPVAVPRARRHNLVLDIHGVLLGRQEPAGHASAAQVLGALRRDGHLLRFLTNASSQSRAEIATQLNAAGIEVRPQEIVTAALVVAHCLRRLPVAPRLYVIGSDAMRSEIERICGHRMSWASPEDADTLVVSRDPALGEPLLRRLAANRGIERVIATCKDMHFPVGDRVETGPGPTVQRVEFALGREALVLGKPNPFALTQVMGLSAAELAGTLVVGDSLEQDVALARAAGARAVWLRPPGSSAAQGPQPHHVLDTLDALHGLLAEEGVPA